MSLRSHPSAKPSNAPPLSREAAWFELCSNVLPLLLPQDTLIGYEALSRYALNEKNRFIYTMEITIESTYVPTWNHTVRWGGADSSFLGEARPACERSEQKHVIASAETWEQSCCGVAPMLQTLEAQRRFTTKLVFSVKPNGGKLSKAFCVRPHSAQTYVTQRQLMKTRAVLQVHAGDVDEDAPDRDSGRARPGEGARQGDGLRRHDGEGRRAPVLQIPDQHRLL